MSRTIDQFVAAVRNAIYGSQVREAIAKSMEETYDACIDATALPEGGTTNQVLVKNSNSDFDVKWADGSGGGSITVDSALSGTSTNPVQNKVIKSALDAKGTYSKPSGGIPASDLASGVIPTVHNVPSGGTTNQVLAKKSNTDYDLKWVDQSGGGGGTTEVAWVTYGTTGSSDIETAYQAGKVVMCIRNGLVYILVNRYSSTVHIFSCTASDAVYYIMCSSGTWTNWSLVAAQAVEEVTNTASGDVAYTMDANKFYHFTGAISSLTLTLTAPSSGLAEYHFDFDSGSTAATVSATGVTWPGGSFTPEANKHYEVDILNGYAVAVAW